MATTDDDKDIDGDGATATKSMMMATDDNNNDDNERAKNTTMRAHIASCVTLKVQFFIKCDIEMDITIHVILVWENRKGVIG